MITLPQIHQNALRELDEMKKDEIVIEACENCGNVGYGKAWFGHGRETGDAWGDRFEPTGSVVFCKDCAGEFEIGKEWNGQEIWKRTSDREEHSQIRENSIKHRDIKASGYNEAIDGVKLAISHHLSKAYEEGVEEGKRETIAKWESAIIYSGDTESCLDKKIMMNHFNEAKLPTPKTIEKKEKWTRHFRGDKGTWEDICRHGVGHEKGIHGCDGCCEELSRHVVKTKEKI